MSKTKKPTVIVIGNSPTVFLEKRGETIDKYDIVIRVNNCPTDGFEEFIGSKTDIWATTKNTVHHNNFVPNNIDALKEVWHRTELSRSRCKFPKELKDVPSRIMYKTPEFRKKFDKYLEGIPTVMALSPDKNVFVRKEYHDTLKGSKHEMCTGLVTILTATSIYEKVDILGFTFYTEQSSGRATGYYREKQKNKKTGKHTEDLYWRENEKSGFASNELAEIKRNIILDYIKEGVVTPLNDEEIYGNIKMEPV